MQGQEVEQCKEGQMSLPMGPWALSHGKGIGMSEDTLWQGIVSRMTLQQYANEANDKRTLTHEWEGLERWD